MGVALPAAEESFSDGISQTQDALMPDAGRTQRPAHQAHNVSAGGQSIAGSAASRSSPGMSLTVPACSALITNRSIW